MQLVYIIDDGKEIERIINNKFIKDDAIEFFSVHSNEIVSKIVDIPVLFIINEDGIEKDIMDVINEIRCNEDNSIVPIALLSSDTSEKHKIEILKSKVEFYIEQPFNEELFYLKIKNLITLMYNNRTVSPLTRTSWEYTNSS